MERSGEPLAVTDQLAGFAAELSLDDVPDAVKAFVKSTLR